MYITAIPNRSSPPAILLRESDREDGKVKTRTLANLSKLPDEAIDLLKRHLAGEEFISTTNALQIIRSCPHGHVQAVRSAMSRLGFERLISARPCRERALVVAMVAARILEPGSKLATTRWLENTALPEALGIEDADEDALYGAMDWLYERQNRIEKKLAKRHLQEGGLVLYDLSSSYFEGCCCPLATRGHNRDKKQGKLQVNYGLLTDAQGRPVSISVFDGNTSDSKTLLPQIERVQQQFGIQKIVIVGDRGMISQAHIDHLKEDSDLHWITALKSGAIRKLIDARAIQQDLFDEHNLFELFHPDYPDERLVACRNPALAERRSKKRKSLLEETTKCLKQIGALLERGKLGGEQAIRKRVKKILGQTGLDQCLILTIGDKQFDFEIPNQVDARNALLERFTGELEKIRSRVDKGHLLGCDKITKRLNLLCKRFHLTDQIFFDVRDNGFDSRFSDQNNALQTALVAFQDELLELHQLVAWGRYGGQDKIGIRLGKIINKYKVGKHFLLDIQNTGFTFSINEEKVTEEAALDGVYVIRTNTNKDHMSAEKAVRSYKSLSQVERAFRTIKTIDLEIRPIHHRLENRVRMHIFLCMLAYYVEWHMREAWRPLLFSDEDLEAKATRDPVAPAERSEAALEKVQTKQLSDGSKVHSFRTLIQSLGTIVLNTAYLSGTQEHNSTFEIITTPNATQQRALDLLKNIRL